MGAEDTQEPAAGGGVAAGRPPIDLVKKLCFEHAVKRSKEDDVVEDISGDADDDVKDIQGLVVSVVAALALFFTLIWMTAPHEMYGEYFDRMIDW